MLRSNDQNKRRPSEIRQNPDETRQRLPIIVGITGASGVIYGRRLVEELARHKWPVDLIVSEGARAVLREELGWSCPEGSPLLPHFSLTDRERLLVREWDNRDLAAPPASGTYPCRAAVIVPTSMKTCAALAHGYCDNLITRAGDVALKQRRTLLLVPRETPMSSIHLNNLLTLSQNGAIILPAIPGFYHAPRTIDDLVNFLVMKMFDSLGLPHNFPYSWKADSPNRT